MAEHLQYIGARYVPKFADPVEWQTNVAYEPLTIVTRYGNSYTSKKSVPAGVDPANAPEYWAATGNYNAQVEEYREQTQAVKQEVRTELEGLNQKIAAQDVAIETQAKEIETQAKEIEETKNALKEVKNRKILLISDSYGIPSATGGKSWQDFAEDFTSTPVVKAYKGGCGFGWPTNNEAYFPNFFNTLDADPDITDILILCGANDGNLIADGGTDAAKITGGISEGARILKTKYPSAKINLGFVGRHKAWERLAAYSQACEVYRSCYTSGIVFAENFQYILHDVALIADSDVHPSLEGSKRIGRYAATFLQNGSIDVKESKSYSTDDYRMTITLNNDICVLDMVANAQYGFLAVMNPQISEYLTTPMGTALATTMFRPLTNPVIRPGSATVYALKNDNSGAPLNCFVSMTNDKLFMETVDPHYNQHSTDYQALYIKSLHMVCPSMYC